MDNNTSTRADQNAGISAVNGRNGANNNNDQMQSSITRAAAMNIFGQSKNMQNLSSEINMSKGSVITDSSSFINNTGVVPKQMKLIQIDEISPTRKAAVDNAPLYVPTRRDRDNNENVDVNNSLNSGGFKAMINRRDRNTLISINEKEENTTDTAISNKTKHNVNQQDYGTNASTTTAANNTKNNVPLQYNSVGSAVA